MRCKYCDKKLEPHQYKWDEHAKEWKETCGGRCVLSNEGRAELDELEEADEGIEEVYADGVVQRWEGTPQSE